MKSAVETLEPTKVKLTVEVTPEELAPALKAAYAEVSKQITVPGFRKGKVPARIIDQRVGFEAVLDYAVQEHLGTWYGGAMDEHHLHPLDRAQIDLESAPTAEERDKPVVFTAEVEIRPEIELPELSGIEVSVPPVEVTDEDVDLGIESLRERFATLTGVDRPAAKDDYVSMDLKATIGDQEIDSVSGVSYQVGSGGMLDGLDEALEGLSAGETTTFEAPLAGGDHEGEQGLIEVTVQSVKERELPAVDQEFVELASAFDTVEELRDDMRTRLAQVKKSQQFIQARDGLVEKLTDAVEIPVPGGILAQAAERETAGVEDEDRKKELTDALESRIRNDLLLDTLAEKLNVQVTQGDLVSFLVEAASASGADPSEYVERMQAAGRMPLIIGQIARAKAIDAALLQTVVTDTDGNPIDLSALVPQTPADDPDADIELDDEPEATEGE